MNRNVTFWCLGQVLVLVGTLCNSNLPAVGAESNVVHTNWTERWITNDIEVRIPTNVFVDEFHTNFVKQFVTNVVDVYTTNLLAENVTNMLVVEVTNTATVPEYKTNWNTVFQTNEVAVAQTKTNVIDTWRTNLSTVLRTNEIAVELFHTNYAARWSTNWKTFTVTNWENVLVMKTNYVSHPYTNIVQINLIGNGSAPKQVAAAKPVEQPKEPAPQAQAPAPPPAMATLTDALTFEASRAPRPTANVGEVRLRVRWKSDPDAPLQVQQWRVERYDGSVLCFGQDPEFRRELPVGKYRIEVRAQADANSPLLAAKDTLVLSPTDAVMLAKTSGGKL